MGNQHAAKERPEIINLLDELGQMSKAYGIPMPFTLIDGVFTIDFVRFGSLSSDDPVKNSTALGLRQLKKLAFSIAELTLEASKIRKARIAKIAGNTVESLLGVLLGNEPTGHDPEEDAKLKELDDKIELRTRVFDKLGILLWLVEQGTVDPEVFDTAAQRLKLEELLGEIVPKIALADDDAVTTWDK